MTPSPDAAATASADARGVITRTRGILGRLAVLAIVVLLLGQILVAWFAVTGFEKALAPQLVQKAGAVGRAVADQFEFVVDELGIPPRRAGWGGPLSRRNPRRQRGHRIPDRAGRFFEHPVLRGDSRPRCWRVFCPVCQAPTARRAQGPRSTASSTACSRSSVTVTSPPCCTWASAANTCADGCPSSCTRPPPSSWSPCS